jgi:hypothetical protein
MAPAGRPKIGKQKRKRVNVMIEPDAAAYLKKVGDGSVSMGIHLIVIRHMAQAIFDHVQKLPMPKKGKRAASNQPGGK